MKVSVPLFDGRREFETDRDALLRAATDVLEGGSYILGDHVARFEDALASYLNVEHVVGVASGTDALMLALRAVDVGPGDRVLTTPYSFFATAGAIVNVGAEPVFVDIEPDTMNIDPVLVEEALEGRSEVLHRLGVDPGTIKAIVPVHLFGHPADLDSLLRTERSKGIAVVQDAAQALGSSYRGQAIGSHRDVVTFSFFPTKNLGGFGDGGAISTNSAEIAERIRSLRAHGATGKYVHDVVGTNSRLDALQAALLSVRLPQLPGRLAARERIAATYEQAFASIGDALIPSHREPGRTFHQYVVRVGDDRRDGVRRELAALGVQTAVHYPVPLSLQPALRDLGYDVNDFPVAEAAASQVLSLPIFPAMSDDEIDGVQQAVKAALEMVAA